MEHYIEFDSGVVGICKVRVWICWLDSVSPGAERYVNDAHFGPCNKNVPVLRDLMLYSLQHFRANAD